MNISCRAVPRQTKVLEMKCEVSLSHQPHPTQSQNGPCCVLPHLYVLKLSSELHGGGTGGVQTSEILRSLLPLDRRGPSNTTANKNSRIRPSPTPFWPLKAEEPVHIRVDGVTPEDTRWKRFINFFLMIRVRVGLIKLRLCFQPPCEWVAGSGSALQIAEIKWQVAFKVY